MTLTNLNGIVKFEVAEQNAIPKWQQTALQDALNRADAPPESLRYQCRIATDAKRNFATVSLPDGETLKLHPKSNPQFGKNREGLAYLTATMIYSGDGETYTVRWVGDNVPSKMQEVAVKHDKGMAVRATTVALDLSNAQVVPSWKTNGKSGPPSTRNYSDEVKRMPSRGAAVKPGPKRSKRNCGRLNDADLLGA